MQVSIIIPTFNRVETLKLTIDSFLGQSLDQNLYEIIISNNNSTDSPSTSTGRNPGGEGRAAQ